MGERPNYTVKRCRLLNLRRRKTARPPGVLMRVRKP